MRPSLEDPAKRRTLEILWKSRYIVIPAAAATGGIISIIATYGPQIAKYFDDLLEQKHEPKQNLISGYVLGTTDYNFFENYNPSYVPEEQMKIAEQEIQHVKEEEEKYGKCFGISCKPKRWWEQNEKPPEDYRSSLNMLVFDAYEKRIYPFKRYSSSPHEEITGHELRDTLREKDWIECAVYNTRPLFVFKAQQLKNTIEAQTGENLTDNEFKEIVKTAGYGIYGDLIAYVQIHELKRIESIDRSYHET